MGGGVGERLAQALAHAPPDVVQPQQDEDRSGEHCEQVCRGTSLIILAVAAAVGRRQSWGRRGGHALSLRHCRSARSSRNWYSRAAEWKALAQCILRLGWWAKHFVPVAARWPCKQRGLGSS